MVLFVSRRALLHFPIGAMMSDGDDVCSDYASASCAKQNNSLFLFSPLNTAWFESLLSHTSAGDQCALPTNGIHALPFAISRSATNNATQRRTLANAAPLRLAWRQLLLYVCLHGSHEISCAASIPFPLSNSSLICLVTCLCVCVCFLPCNIYRLSILPHSNTYTQPSCLTHLAAFMCPSILCVSSLHHATVLCHLKCIHILSLCLPNVISMSPSPVSQHPYYYYWLPCLTCAYYSINILEVESGAGGGQKISGCMHLHRDRDRTGWSGNKVLEHCPSAA